MTKIIAILLAAGQFEVAVATSSGYFTGTYPDTDAGVREFLGAIRARLQSEPGRFYPCIVHDESIQDLRQSALVNRVGPGTAHGTSVIDSDRIKAYAAGRPPQRLDARVAEKICLSTFPRGYMQLFPATAGVREFYRRPRPPTEQQIAMIASCEAVLTAMVVDPRKQYGLALGKVRLWAADELDPSGMQHPVYAQAFRLATAQLQAGSPARDEYLKTHEDHCLSVGLRLD